MTSRTLTAAGLVAMAAVAGCGSTSQSTRSSHPGLGELRAPGALLSRLPYMGVACHIPNSVACDRVGLAVWLRHPAISVSATIAGAPLQLNNTEWSGPANHGRRQMFAGFLHPAGVTTRLKLTLDPGATTWMATVPLGPNTSRYAPEPLVQLRIKVAPGQTVVTRLHVPLAAGWG